MSRKRDPQTEWESGAWPPVTSSLAWRRAVADEYAATLDAVVTAFAKRPSARAAADAARLVAHLHEAVRIEEEPAELGTVALDAIARIRLIGEDVRQGLVKATGYEKKSAPLAWLRGSAAGR